MGPWRVGHYDVRRQVSEEFHKLFQSGTSESEVLALARSLADPLVLMDDEIAQAEGRRLNLRLCGTTRFVGRGRGATPPCYGLTIHVLFKEIRIQLLSAVRAEAVGESSIGVV
jgi:hypothetical protein